MVFSTFFNILIRALICLGLIALFFEWGHVILLGSIFPKFYELDIVRPWLRAQWNKYNVRCSFSAYSSKYTNKSDAFSRKREGDRAKWRNHLKNRTNDLKTDTAKDFLYRIFCCKATGNILNNINSFFMFFTFLQHHAKKVRTRQTCFLSINNLDFLLSSQELKQPRHFITVWGDADLKENRMIQNRICNYCSENINNPSAEL